MLRLKILVRVLAITGAANLRYFALISSMPVALFTVNFEVDLEQKIL